MMFVGVRLVTYPAMSNKTGPLLGLNQFMLKIDPGPIMGQGIRPLRPKIPTSRGIDPSRLWPHDGFSKVGPVFV